MTDFHPTVPARNPDPPDVYYCANCTELVDYIDENGFCEQCALELEMD